VNTARGLLPGALLGLGLLYVAWFAREPDVAALVVFALPPFLLALALLRGRARAGFWAGLLALLWFSHGVMVAWSRPHERAFALAEVGLSLAIVFAASLPGLRARFGRRG
jgi:uncharacterized membrane protein